MSRRDPLETVHRLRRIREQQAQAELARASADADAAQEGVAARRQELTAAATDMPTTLPATLLRSLHLRGLASVENLVLAEAEWERAVQRQRDATRRVVQAAADRRSVEKLAQRREAEALAVRAAAAERALDELHLITSWQRDEEVPS